MGFTPDFLSSSARVPRKRRNDELEDILSASARVSGVTNDLLSSSERRLRTRRGSGHSSDVTSHGSSGGSAARVRQHRLERKQDSQHRLKRIGESELPIDGLLALHINSADDEVEEISGMTE